MSHVRDPKKTNFKPSPQTRRMGSGKGRVCRAWRGNWPWLVMAAERICVEQAGDEGVLLEDRRWSKVHRITKLWLRDRLEYLFPGVRKYIEGSPGGEDPWRDLLNRVYKMYYKGTSDGNYKDAITRPTISDEHWRHWEEKGPWEGPIARIVKADKPVHRWVNWI